MKLAILETGTPPGDLESRFGDYPAMFARMRGSGFDFESFDVQSGRLPRYPDGHDAYLITGSPAGVYEDHAWLDPLRDFIRRAYSVRTKMVGICFGHQVIANALGGEVRKSEKGWGLGRHNYEILPFAPYFDLPRASLSIACSHQDQVITPPEQARVVLRSDFAPNAGLVYRNGAAMSFQPHPEFGDPYARALIDLRRGRASDDVIEKAGASMCQPSDSALLVRAITRFLAS